MKINSNVLTDFLKKVNMSGAHLIDEVVLDFAADGMRATVMSDDSTIRVDGILLKSAFDQYDEIGKIGIQELSKLLTIVKAFDDDLTITTNDTTIEIKSKQKKVELPLLDIQFITSPKKIKDFEFSETMTLPVKFIQSFISDAAINKDFSLNFETGEKRLTLRNDGKFKFTKEIEIDTAMGGVNVTFHTPFIDAVKNLSNDIDLSLSTNFPCRVLEKYEDSAVSFIIAPKIDEE